MFLAIILLRKETEVTPNSKRLSIVSRAHSAIPKCLFVRTAAMLLPPPGVSWSKCIAVGREEASKSPCALMLRKLHANQNLVFCFKNSRLPKRHRYTLSLKMILANMFTFVLQYFCVWIVKISSLTRLPSPRGQQLNLFFNNKGLSFPSACQAPNVKSYSWGSENFTSSKQNGFCTIIVALYQKSNTSFRLDFWPPKLFSKWKHGLQNAIL